MVVEPIFNCVLHDKIDCNVHATKHFPVHPIILYKNSVDIRMQYLKKQTFFFIEKYEVNRKYPKVFMRLSYKL